MANIQPFVILFRELKTIPGFWNKLKFTFAKPGWYPKEMGGYKPAPEVDRTKYKKYDVEVSPTLNFYLFTQYIIILGATAFFLFTQAAYPGYLQLLMAGVIIFSVAALGMLFENKQQAVKLEVLRFLFGMLLTGYLYFAGIVPFWIPVILFIISVVSVAVLTKIKFHQLAQVD